MKNRSLSIIAIFASSLIYSCKGPDGAIGPKGANGTNGATGAIGATGAKGADGNTNVVYSEWRLSYKSSADYFTNMTGQRLITAIQLLPITTDEPILSKEAYRTGSVYTYAKFNALVYDSDNKTYKLSERIKLLVDNTTVESYSLIPGRNKDLSTSYTRTSLFNVEIRENYFSFFGYNSLRDDGTQAVIPEFQGKVDLAFFQKPLMLDTIILVRHVIINGTMKGRIASIDMSDYGEVKRALNLRD